MRRYEPGSWTRAVGVKRARDRRVQEVGGEGHGFRSGPAFPQPCEAPSQQLIVIQIFPRAPARDEPMTSPRSPSRSGFQLVPGTGRLGSLTRVPWGGADPLSATQRPFHSPPLPGHSQLLHHRSNANKCKLKCTQFHVEHSPHTRLEPTVYC